MLSGERFDIAYSDATANPAALKIYCNVYVYPRYVSRDIQCSLL